MFAETIEAVIANDLLTESESLNKLVDSVGKMRREDIKLPNPSKISKVKEEAQTKVSFQFFHENGVEFFEKDIERIVFQNGKIRKGWKVIGNCGTEYTIENITNYPKIREALSNLLTDKLLRRKGLGQYKKDQLNRQRFRAS